MDKIKFMHDVLDVVMGVNGGAVARSKDGHPTAFFNYSGHVNWVEVEIYPGGWPGERKEFRFYFSSEYLTDHDHEMRFKEMRDYARRVREESHAYAFKKKFERRKKWA